MNTTAALLRHFADLRDGRHGDDAVSREEKEELFRRAVELLQPYAKEVLQEMNAELLLSSGTIAGGETTRSADGGIEAAWTLSWPEQVEAGIEPISLVAFYGAEFHHPHLRGATVGVWPLNVFDEEQAASEAPVLRAIAAADLHNLVYQRDFHIVPATVAGRQ